MIYRGYIAWYAHEPQDDVMYGRIAGIHDVITFVAPTLEEMEHEFHVSVDDYLSFCAEKGREPDPPPDPDGPTRLENSYRGFTGSFEVDPENGVLHGRIDGIDDITFEADRLWDLERKFRRSVDDFLASDTGSVVALTRPYAKPTRAAS